MTTAFSVYEKRIRDQFSAMFGRQGFDANRDIAGIILNRWGHAYLAPQPGNPPFVRLGDVVTEGQPLLIIEAMKVMNQIRAHRPGRIAQILVADTQPVEYGAILMLIE